MNVFIIFVNFLGWIVSIWVRLVRLTREKEALRFWKGSNYKNEIYNNYLTQKLNKNNKIIHNSDCILAPKKKKKTILLPKNQKIMCYWRS